MIEIFDNTGYGLKAKITLDKWNEKFGSNCDINIDFDGYKKCEVTKLEFETINMLIANQEEILSKIFDYVLEVYSSIRELALEITSSENKYGLTDRYGKYYSLAMVPNSVSKEDLYQVLKLQSIKIHKEKHDDIHIVSYKFECAWSSLHKINLIVYKDKVLGWENHRSIF